jgi:hypothetical protein
MLVAQRASICTAPLDFTLARGDPSSGADCFMHADDDRLRASPPILEDGAVSSVTRRAEKLIHSCHGVSPRRRRAASVTDFNARVRLRPYPRAPGAEEGGIVVRVVDQRVNLTAWTVAAYKLTYAGYRPIEDGIHAPVEVGRHRTASVTLMANGMQTAGMATSTSSENSSMSASFQRATGQGCGA